ncbi:MAG TPA: DNA-binding response regulator, partial [Flavobacterium sp.]|nr:DNA-binding response regulator [Flavobacterium sp.]
MTHSYIIIDDNRASLEQTLSLTSRFPALQLAGTAGNYEDGLNLILEHNPELVFLEIDPADKQSRLSLALINELYRYLTIIPKIIVTTGMTDLAYEAIRHEVFDYLIKPIEVHAFRRTLFRLGKICNDL